MTGGRKPGQGGQAIPPVVVEARKRSGMAPAPPRSAPKRKKRAPHPPGITTDQYNALQASYFKTQSISAAAKAANVKFTAAKFYIEGPGKPEFGMAPIRQTWLDIQVEVQEKRQLTLVKFHEEQTKELEEILMTSLGELKLIRASVLKRIERFRDSNGTDIETSMNLAAAIKSYERVARLMERFLGAPDATLAHRGEDQYRNWTDEEIMNYMTTGAVPGHAR